jgi:RNA polymerase sigma factor (sigma-70 family)
MPRNLAHGLRMRDLADALPNIPIICHMDRLSPSLMMYDTTLQRQADPMERSELECELERLHPDCWGWALACCSRDRLRAEEALQIAYLRILSGRARFDGRSQLKTWVFGVIRLTALEESRRWRQWFVRAANGKLAHDVADPSPDADVAVDVRDRRRALIVALAGLSSRQREVLQLVFYHDLSIEAAASVMKISVGSARTHYERGKKSLRAGLAAFGEG